MKIASGPADNRDVSGLLLTIGATMALWVLEMLRVGAICAYCHLRLLNTRLRVLTGRQVTSYTVADPWAATLARRSPWTVDVESVGPHAWQVRYGADLYAASGVKAASTRDPSESIHGDRAALDLALAVSRTVTVDGQTARGSFSLVGGFGDSDGDDDGDDGD